MCSTWCDKLTNQVCKRDSHTSDQLRYTNYYTQIQTTKRIVLAYGQHDSTCVQIDDAWGHEPHTPCLRVRGSAGAAHVLTIMRGHTRQPHREAKSSPCICCCLYSVVHENNKRVINSPLLPIVRRPTSPGVFYYTSRGYCMGDHWSELRLAAAAVDAAPYLPWPIAFDQRFHGGKAIASLGPLGVFFLCALYLWYSTTVVRVRSSELDVPQSTGAALYQAMALHTHKGRCRILYIYVLYS